jgi:hypothetical protein
MNEDEKRKIVQRLTARVDTGIGFVDEYLSENMRPDAAYIRNIYILLSFYTELLLKAIYIIEKDFSDLADLDKKLRTVGHNLESIGVQIGEKTLLKFHIRSIEHTNDEYVIDALEGVFPVKDFIDIRYDFLEDGRVRFLKGDEHQVFEDQIKFMRLVNKDLKTLVW